MLWAKIKMKSVSLLTYSISIGFEIYLIWRFANVATLISIVFPRTQTNNSKNGERSNIHWVNIHCRLCYCYCHCWCWCFIHICLFVCSFVCCCYPVDCSLRRHSVSFIQFVAKFQWYENVLKIYIYIRLQWKWQRQQRQ